MIKLAPYALALLAATSLAGVARAQSNPNAAQIIDQLSPTGAVSDTTRGIKPLSAGPAESAAPLAGPATPAASEAPVAAAAPEAAPAAAPSANLEIQFVSGSATLTTSATAELDQLGAALTSASLSADNFKIVGHTDTVGDATTNQSLSVARAAAVKSYLETKFSIAGARLQSEGVGETDLAVQTPANTPEAHNRRVEIINLGQ